MQWIPCSMFESSGFYAVDFMQYDWMQWIPVSMIECSGFYAAWPKASWLNAVDSIMLHVIHCIQSGCILPGCMESTAFNHAAWNPMHAIGMHFTRLHGIHCIQSCCGNPLHSIILHGIHCIQSGFIGPRCLESTAFNHAAGIHGIQSCCIKDTSFNRIPLLHAAWNTLNSITLHGIQCIQ